MADGRIIIDTRIRKDNAKKDLNELRKDAQATASEISKIDQKIHEAQGDTKLADDLKNAQAAAAATEKELEMIDAALIKMKRSGQGNTESFLSMQQAGEGLREKYNAQLAAQSKAQAAYDRQQASIAGMTAARGILAGQLAETQKFEQQASAIQRAKVAVTSFENSLRKAGGAFGSLIKRAKTFMSHMIKAPKLMGNFGSRMREIAFGALLFNGISAALRNFTTGLQNALRQSGAFVTTMSNLKGAALNATAPLVSALTPALTALANAAAVALSYLSRLFAFFTGKSISGLKATAKAMGGAASSAKELKNNMLGIDELNVVDSGASGGGGGGLGNIEPNYGFEGQNDFLDTLMAAIESGDWAGAGILLADKVNSMVESVDAYSWGQKLGAILQNGIVFGYSFLTTFDWNGLGAKLAGFVNGLLDKVDGAQLGALFAAKFTIAIRTLGTFLANLDWATLGTQLSSFAIGFLSALADSLQSVDWSAIGTGIATLLMNIDWAGVISAVFEVIKAAFPILLPGLLAFIGMHLVKMIGSSLLSMLITSAGQSISTFFSTMLPTVLSNLSTWLTTIISSIGLWPIAIAGLVVLFIAVVNQFGDAIQAKLQEVDAWLQGIFTRDWSETFGILGNLLNAFFSNVKNIWDSIKLVFDGIIDFIRGVFTGDWERAWKGVKEIFAGIFGALKAVALAPINAIIGILNGLIDSINWVIEKVNGISFTNPFTGNTVGFNFPSIGKIPYLAQGAVIPPNREFMAVLGDQTSGRNLEAPEDLIRQIVREESSGAPMSLEVEQPIQLLLDGEVIYRTVTRIKANRGAAVSSKFAEEY